MKTHRRSGFTLVEILIVVVILGILAAIVVPQFSEASSEAKINTLRGNLQTMRSQLELYKIQHDDLLPGQSVIGGDVLEADFMDNLMNDAKYNSYFQKFPSNDYMVNAADRTRVTCVNAAGDLPDGTEGTGWWFNAADGDFRAASAAGHIDY